MVFNSIDFLIFFIIVFILFYYSRGFNRQVILLVSSSVFYMWFIPSYILILFLTILIDYFAAIRIEDSTKPATKKLHLLFGIINTCIVLFVFKYYNFFVDNLNYLGFRSARHWEIILPIGLSFHVFQSLGYVIEVYKGKIKAERNLLIYSNFVMMFPQLVAGPIERAENLLPQLRKDNPITYRDFTVGLSQFFWGLFKKVAVADVLSQYVDTIFNSYMHHSGFTFFITMLMFTYQLYCDFSGYSDMAIGVARMLGYRFNENFKLPFFSTSITELWRKWHISLSNWLRDYVYFSLGGTKKGKLIAYRNLFITMLIGGLWHGASWNFVIWGLIYGVYLTAEKLLNFTLRSRPGFIYKAIGYIYVHLLIMFPLILFRSVTFDQASYIIHAIFTDFYPSKFNALDIFILMPAITGWTLMTAFEYFVLRKFSFDDIYEMKSGNLYLNALTIFITVSVFLQGNINETQFIYFQF
ncbi:MBOAT family O-acyltransferase [Emticicia fluvialis]|uniref:MBOAT family O-acyltransferase n=1 Tax=Emticicia fluvialis TaxID=2974474 RepID=UPI0021655946|nr:MBOAT family O-acyltransferase [Emticicia fluvialis]